MHGAFLFLNLVHIGAKICQGKVAWKFNFGLSVAQAMVVPPEVTTAVELRSVLLKPGPRQICLDRMHVWVLSICRRSTRRVELTGSFSLSAVRKPRLVLHIPI